MNQASFTERAPATIDAGRLVHAYIAGGELADAVAMAAVCSGAGEERPCRNCSHCDKAARGIHPDILVISKLEDKRDISIDQIRFLHKDCYIVPGEAARKVYIINNADEMSIPAQNAFLKILEEPPSFATFVLKTDNPAALASTVTSRCRELSPGRYSQTAGGEASKVSDEFFTALGQGNLEIARFMFRLEKLGREGFEAFLSCAREQAAAGVRDASQGKATLAPDVLELSERVLAEAFDYLKLNVNVGHISGMICARLMK